MTPQENPYEAEPIAIDHYRGISALPYRELTKQEIAKIGERLNNPWEGYNFSEMLEMKKYDEEYRKCLMYYATFLPAYLNNSSEKNPLERDFKQPFWEGFKAMFLKELRIITLPILTDYLKYPKAFTNHQLELHFMNPRDIVSPICFCLPLTPFVTGGIMKGLSDTIADLAISNYASIPQASSLLKALRQRGYDMGKLLTKAVKDNTTRCIEELPNYRYDSVLSLVSAYEHIIELGLLVLPEEMKTKYKEEMLKGLFIIVTNGRKELAHKGNLLPYESITEQFGDYFTREDYNATIAKII